MESMSLANTLAVAIALALGAPLAVAQVAYYESFDIGVGQPPGCHIAEFPGGPGTYPFPAGWTLFNVDNGTPAAQVSFVNDAWEVREDFSHEVTQCVAFSTSWYEPPVPADDWMWTPAIVVPAGAELSWRAVSYDAAYRDGYEVRVLDEAPGSGNLLDSTVVFSTPAEETAWTQRSVSLAAYAGQAVHIAFRNHSSDKFLLLVDDVKVEIPSPDLTVSTPWPFASIYTRVPAGWMLAESPAAQLLNGGAGELTNVTGSATAMLDGAPTVQSVAADAVPSIPEGASAAAVFGEPLTFAGDGAWSIEYTFSADQVESDLADNVVLAAGPVIGGDELARHEGPVIGTLGIGAGNGGEIGVTYTLVDAADFRGVRFGLDPIPPEEGDPPMPSLCPGFDFVAILHAVDDVTGAPGTVIDTTVPVPCNYDEGGLFDADFAGGQLNLPAGTYVLTLQEPVGGPTLRLQMHGDRFVPGASWVYWPTIPGGTWMHLEDFGPTFSRAPSLSLLSVTKQEPPIFQDGFELAPPPGVAQARRVAAPAILSVRPTRSVAPTQLAPSR